MSTSMNFPGLSAYGNYDATKKLPRGICRIELDGTIRMIRKLGIPEVDITSLEWAYGNHYFPRRVGYAIRQHDMKRLKRALESQTAKRADKAPAPHPDLLLCIREASRAAHRE
ncbi:MAG TPA: hypothetical protein VJU82_12740, partial [Acidobacteriaceae bacterium]|nr:hypothetical protein [Acidobacteriaceae bacterium]